MSTQQSEQVTKINLESTGQAQWLDPNDLGARQRVAKFNFNTTDDINAALAEGDVVWLVKIPKGAMLYGIQGYHEAMGTDQIAKLGIAGADGSGTYDSAGTADDIDFFTNDLTNDGIDVAAVGEFIAGIKQLEGFGYLTTKEVYITMTLFDVTSSDAFAADKDFDGVVYYTDNT